MSTCAPAVKGGRFLRGGIGHSSKLRMPSASQVMDFTRTCSVSVMLMFVSLRLEARGLDHRLPDRQLGALALRHLLAVQVVRRHPQTCGQRVADLRRRENLL